MIFGRPLPVTLGMLAIVGAACSSSTSTSSPGSGGASVQGGTRAGGAISTGGTSSSGGNGSGGAGGSGGVTIAGGTTSSGGTAVGGSAVGGSGAGGQVGSGGKTGAGGASTTGGAGGGVATGGANGGSAAGGSSASGGKTGAGGATGVGGSTGTAGPCDLYQSANTPCVGAYSTVRALYGAYIGPLYQVRRTSDKQTKDIPLLSPGGYADSSVQDAFCTGACTISILYDQSPKKNDMPVSGVTYWLKSGGTESDAKAVKISVGGHPVYGVKFVSGKGNSYRNMKPNGTATGDQAEAMYEVVDSKVYNSLCCNDFGNAETTGNPDGAATMEAIYWGSCTLFGGGSDKGPWLLADLEAGTFASDKATDTNNTPLITPAFATLMLKGFSGNRYAMKGGDAQTGSLITKWDGKRPNGYTPMKKQGAIVLGTGGDGSFYSTGVFFEGAITSGCPDDNALDDAIQANIVAAGYGK